MLRSVPAAQLIAFAVCSLWFSSLAQAQTANSRSIEPLAAQRLNKERQIRGYELGQPTRSRSARARTEHFAYRPTIDGVSVLNGEIAIHLDDKGRTIRSTENGVPREPRSRTFTIAKERASELAAQAVGASPGAAVHVKQVYFVAARTTEPAYQVYVETPRGGPLRLSSRRRRAKRSG